MAPVTPVCVRIVCARCLACGFIVSAMSDTAVALSVVEHERYAHGWPAMITHG